VVIIQRKCSSDLILKQYFELPDVIYYAEVLLFVDRMVHEKFGFTALHVLFENP